MTEVTVSFRVDHEVHNRADFQRAGHFVPGLKDSNGFARPWSGTDVHILTLYYDSPSPLANRQQVLRVLSDSEQEAALAMAARIKETLWAHWTASSVATTEADEWRRLNHYRNQLQHFVNAHYGHEAKQGKHTNLPTVFDVAVHYLKRERNSILNRLCRLIRRQKIEPCPWVPPDWT